MGIKGLMKFLQENAPKSVREVKGPEAFTGRMLAVDASMCLYQFLIMIREGHSGAYSNLINAEGQVTSHIVGFLSRTIRLMEAGIKPVYVFDGKPPDLKQEELDQRREKRVEAEQALEAAKETGDSEQVLRSTKMTVKVTKEQTEQTKKLLKLMGTPVVEAPSEAEATCAALCKAGKVYASATEDADCLTFGTLILIRNLFAAESQKKTIYEVSLPLALEQLGISMDQFIDFCILCGCDYCDSLKGIGPNTAIRLIVQHGSLEKVVASLDPSKTPIPPGFRYQAARRVFQECEAADPSSLELCWAEPDFDGLRKFLVEENSFSEDRVERFLGRLRAAKQKTKQQPLSMFFGAPKKIIQESDKFDPSKGKRGAAKAQTVAPAKLENDRVAAATSAMPPAKVAKGANVTASEEKAPTTKAEPKAKGRAKSKGEPKAKAKGKAKSKAGALDTPQPSTPPAGRCAEAGTPPRPELPVAKRARKT